MSRTFTNLLTHVVFRTKDRQPLILPELTNMFATRKPIIEGHRSRKSSLNFLKGPRLPMMSGTFGFESCRPLSRARSVCRYLAHSSRWATNMSSASPTGPK